MSALGTVLYVDTTQNCQFGESTLHGYAIPFRTLNGELLHHSHLRCLFVVRQAPFLTGSSQGLALNAVLLILPKLIVRLLQLESISIPSSLKVLLQQKNLQIIWSVFRFRHNFAAQIARIWQCIFHFGGGRTQDTENREVEAIYP